MLAYPSRLIVEDSTCVFCAAPTKRVHHRNFPEIRAECGSVVDGIAYLAGRLSRVRDNVASEWHREAIDQAMADLAACHDATAEAGQDGEASCRCDVQGADEWESSLPGLCPFR